MYDHYINAIKDILTKKSIKDSSFKSNTEYNYILEHVTFDLGNNYIKCIKHHFPNITYNNVFEFVSINDKYGCPKKDKFVFSEGQILFCSATSLRYVFHSLILLRHYETKSSCKNMVELGCGYGGLFLAICYFSKLYNINVDHYYLIDLPVICDLIKEYLELYNDIINIKYSIHSSYNYGADIEKTDLFFISNYCFTEISNDNRNKYIQVLFPSISNGFIIWQTCFGLSIENTYIINKKIEKVIEELPQTNSQQKNYFVYF